VYARTHESIENVFGGIAGQNGTIPRSLGSVLNHLCISQLQEAVYPI
jgi:hypothetical protein